MIELNNVSKKYGDQIVLDGFFSYVWRPGNYLPAGGVRFRQKHAVQPPCRI